MIDLKQYELWFVTGVSICMAPRPWSRLRKIRARSHLLWRLSTTVPVKVVFKPVLTTPDSIRELCLEANSAKNCVGLITWMHTFSPAKMWIAGLSLLKKPFLHLHTQYNREIPWSEIDMNFMNLNQSAHGDRNLVSSAAVCDSTAKLWSVTGRMRGFQSEIGVWSRAACAWADWQGAKIARFGDNMRDVAVTEGDKVEAQLRFGYDVYGYGVGDLVKAVNEVSDAEINQLVQTYLDEYEVLPPCCLAARSMRLCAKVPGSRSVCAIS